MKLALISDTHGLHWRMPPIPDADVLIHAGDCLNAGKLAELPDFLRWFRDQPHKRKILIAGNHDWAFERNNTAARAYCLDAGIDYLQDEALVIDDITFYGSPWQPEFCDWAFNLPRGEKLAAKWADINDATDVLITHGPAYGILDLTPGGEHVGCEDLRSWIDQMCFDGLHVFGHIHHSYGSFGRWFNAAICNERYEPVNLPMEFEL